VAALPVGARPHDRGRETQSGGARAEDGRRQARSVRNLARCQGIRGGSTRRRWGAAGAPLLDGTIPPRANQFWDIGFGLEGGLPLRPWAAELVKKRIADDGKDNPDAHCLPMGLMQLHNHPQPRKIVQTRDLIVIMYEGNAGLRQIHMDGRPLPDNDPQPWWYGYSTGRWDGDTLVVQTTGFRDDGWLDINGSPLTDAAKWTERFRRPNHGSLEIEITVDDPKAYTRPWTVKIEQRLMLDTELIEFVCAENEKSSAHFGK
jgi:hypothetical protein